MDFAFFFPFSFVNCSFFWLPPLAIYAFKCSNAEQLFQTLIEVINNTLTSSALNGVNNGGNIQNSHASHLQNPSPNSRSPLNSLNAHEYQNLASFEGDNSMLRTLPADDFRSHSAMGSDHHTYLNSASTNVIGIKSQPNYYTSNPLSYNSPQFFGSKNCLSTNSGSRSPGFFTNFDSSTLPSMRSANFYHEYVNSNVCTGSQDDTCLSRRKNSESFDSRNNSYVNTANVMEVMRPKIANSDDFCFVNIDLDARRDKGTIRAFLISLFVGLFYISFTLSGMKSRSTRTTPEPYIQLDLQTTKTEEPKSEKGNSSKVTANGEKKKVIQESTSSKGDIGKSSSSTNSKQPKSSTEQKDSKSDGTKSNANISYAQIDFARTIALSNSAASHRKL